jgi:hypothetical protein
MHLEDIEGSGRGAPLILNLSCEWTREKMLFLQCTLTGQETVAYPALTPWNFGK